MYLILGLGNPGTEYEETKHNIGRSVAATLAKEHDLGNFTFEKKANALVAEGKIRKERVTIALPETFMNKSGAAAAALARRLKIKPALIFAVHDDVDLPVGRMKLSFARNSAGHKGVKSVMRALKTNGFYRLRIGIGSPRKTKEAMDIVLKKFAPREQTEMKKVMRRAREALMCAITESPQKAMSIYNA